MGPLRAAFVTFCTHCNGLIELEFVHEPEEAEWTAPKAGDKLGEWVIEWISEPFPVRNGPCPAYAVFVDTSMAPHCDKARPGPQGAKFLK